MVRIHADPRLAMTVRAALVLSSRLFVSSSENGGGVPHTYSIELQTPRSEAQLFGAYCGLGPGYVFVQLCADRKTTARQQPSGYGIKAGYYPQHTPDLKRALKIILADGGAGLAEPIDSGNPAAPDRHRPACT